VSIYQYVGQVAQNDSPAGAGFEVVCDSGGVADSRPTRVFHTIDHRALYHFHFHCATLAFNVSPIHGPNVTPSVGGWAPSFRSPFPELAERLRSPRLAWSPGQ